MHDISIFPPVHVKDYHHDAKINVTTTVYDNLSWSIVTNILRQFD